MNHDRPPTMYQPVDLSVFLPVGDQATLAEKKGVRDLKIALTTQRHQQAKLAYLESQLAQHILRVPFHGMVDPPPVP